MPPSRDPPTDNESRCEVLVVGGGPAGLAAAEAAASGGRQVVVLEGQHRPGVKFLVAGRSGLNLTREASAEVIYRACGGAGPRLQACVEAFPPAAIRRWAAQLATPTFVGSSAKVFPVEHHAAGLLERWLKRLSALGVQIHTRSRVQALQPGADGSWRVMADRCWRAQRVVLALGGGSWPQTGSDGQWQQWLADLGIPLKPLAAANCGVEVAWDERLRQRHQGQALKNVLCQVGDQHSHGEMVITATGLEGYAIYPLVPALRTCLDHQQRPVISLDLARDRQRAQVSERLAQVRSGASFSARLRKALRLSDPAIALVHWAGGHGLGAAPLADLIKALPIPVHALRPINEAISTAGGVSWSALDQNFASIAYPSLSLVGEMVDWQAPTGGYLLSVCLAMGRWAGAAIARPQD